jgi:heme/copper-type cytochrome/quinol oxidase subunit 4
MIVLMAFVIYRPFTIIVRYEGMAFLFSGFLGFLMSVGLGEVPLWLVQAYASKNSAIVAALGGELVLAKYLQQIFTVFTGEIQKLSFVFMALGASLLFLYFYFLGKESREKSSDTP